MHLGKIPLGSESFLAAQGCLAHPRWRAVPSMDFRTKTDLNDSCAKVLMLFPQALCGKFFPRLVFFVLSEFDRRVYHRQDIFGRHIIHDRVHGR